MKVVFLAPANSIHTVRWANALSERNYEITILTMHKPEKNEFHPTIKVQILPFKAPFGYYLNRSSVRAHLRKIKPDLVHTHYASGYGTLARLANYHPTLLSVWGSDVYEFPYQSRSNQKILMKNLQFADRIASTSRAMKAQTEKFYKPDHEMAITPFGIDLKMFTATNREARSDQSITIGMIKTMEKHYGPQYLIEAIPLLLERLEKEKTGLEDKIKVLMVGKGSLISSLETRSKELGISDMVTFTGEIPHLQVPEYLNMLDVYCAPSEMESFGVAVIEASACKIPVIASNVGGIPEVVNDGDTGYLVEKGNPGQIANRLFELVSNKEKRHEFGENGRKFVEENYDWNENVTIIEKIYQKLAGNDQ